MKIWTPPALLLCRRACSGVQSEDLTPSSDPVFVKVLREVVADVIG